MTEQGSFTEDKVTESKSQERLTLKRITLENWTAPDPALANFFGGLNEAGQVESTVPEDWVEMFLAVELSSTGIPNDILEMHTIARNIALYGTLYYPLFTVADNQMFRVADAAVAHCYEQKGGPPPKKGYMPQAARLTWLRSEGHIDQRTFEQWDHLREWRNASTHADYAMLLTPGDCLRAMRDVTEAIAGLFSDSREDEVAGMSREDGLLLLAKQDLQEATRLSFRHLRMSAGGTANGDTELAFVRSMIVAYASPWSSKPNMTVEIGNLPTCLSPDEQRIHKLILQKRKKLYAHTDPSHAKPGTHKDPGGAEMYTRQRPIFSLHDHLALWRNARKLRGAAEAALRSRPGADAVWPISHETVVAEPERITEQEAHFIANETNDEQITGLILHGWRDIDEVLLDEVAQRLGFPAETLHALRDEDRRREVGFPLPRPPRSATDTELRWRIGDVRDWRFRYGLAIQADRWLQQIEQSRTEAE